MSADENSCNEINSDSCIEIVSNSENLIPSFELFQLLINDATYR